MNRLHVFHINELNYLFLRQIFVFLLTALDLNPPFYEHSDSMNALFGHTFQRADFYSSNLTCEKVTNVHRIPKMNLTNNCQGQIDVETYQNSRGSEVDQISEKNLLVQGIDA